MSTPTKAEAQKAVEAMQKLRHLFKTNAISYDNAAFFAKPYLETFNAYSRAKARAAGLTPPRAMSWTGFIR